MWAVKAWGSQAYEFGLKGLGSRRLGHRLQGSGFALHVPKPHTNSA